MMSTKIVEEILAELKGSKGFDWWWDEMDEDIQQGIKYGPCKPGKQHRFTVMASIKVYKNCWYCGMTRWTGK